MKFFEGHETFNSARASCRAMGAELITLETETKAIFFRGFLLYVGKFRLLAVKIRWRLL